MADAMTTDDFGACSVHGAIVCEECAVAARDAEWRAAAERVRKPLATAKPTGHGNCCTCQTCYEDHDNCTCRDTDLHNSALEALLAQMSKEGA